MFIIISILVFHFTHFQKQQIINCLRVSISFKYKKILLQIELLPAGKITVKIKMQKCVKISGGRFVLNVDPSHESGIHIQNNRLHCYAF